MELSLFPSLILHPPTRFTVCYTKKQTKFNTGTKDQVLLKSWWRLGERQELQEYIYMPIIRRTDEFISTVVPMIKEEFNSPAVELWGTTPHAIKFREALQENNIRILKVDLTKGETFEQKLEKYPYASIIMMDLQN